MAELPDNDKAEGGQPTLASNGSVNSGVVEVGGSPASPPKNTNHIDPATGEPDGTTPTTDGEPESVVANPQDPMSTGNNARTTTGSNVIGGRDNTGTAG